MTLPDPIYDPEEAAERGYAGFEVDPTPNENYSLETPQDAPTPETDASAKADAAARKVELYDAMSGKEAPVEAAPAKASRSSSSSSES